MIFPTFILDLANNHNGSVEHGLAIIRAHAEIIRKHNVTAAIKLQLRDHRYHHGDREYNRKFKATRLSDEEHERLRLEIVSQGLATAATPFDPGSAEKIGDFDLAKVASCSAKDWLTIEAVEKSGKPVIYSTGGLSLADIDAMVTFSKSEIALMHCVSLYPTPEHRCNLALIGFMRARYDDGIPIGWSTHERPDAVTPVQMAVAYGATIFERHIGLGEMNAYSSTPEQIGGWVAHWKHAVDVAGSLSASRDDERTALARVERKDAA